MKHFKQFLILALLAIIGTGQMLGETKTIVFTTGSSSSTTAATINTSVSDDIATLSVSTCYARDNGMFISSNNNAGTATLTMKAAGQVKATKIVTTIAGTLSKEISIQVTYTDDTKSTKTGLGTTAGAIDTELDDTKTIKSIQYTAASKSKASISQLVIHVAGSTPQPTLSSVTVSGTPTKTAYENGNAFDATGLTVTGTYSDSSNKTETTGITWTACKTQDGTYVALDNAAALLATGETDIYVKATVSGETSPAFHVTGLTVTAPLPKITITQDQVTSFTNTYAQYTWTAGGVSGKMYAYKNSGMQFNSGQSGHYVYNTNAIPGVIRKITMTKASGTDRNWTPYVSTTALTSATGTALTAKSVTTSGTTWDVTGSNSYFYLDVSGGATVIGSIVITYEEVKNAVTVSTPATGTGTLEVTGAANLSEVLLGAELTVSAAPSATYHGGTVKVIKTGVTPEEDVTSTVYNAGTGKLTMPDYAITVSATFVADAAISVAVATGQSSWGSVKLYDGNADEVSSGTTFKPFAEFMIEAIPTSSDYEFVSWAKSAGSDITLSDADAIDNDPTLTAGEVNTTFTATFREASTPYLAVDPESLTFGPIAVNGSQNKIFGLTGENLTENASLAITGTGAAMFSVAASVAKDGDGAINKNVTVTYNPTAAGTHTATLTISSEGATPVEVALSGEAKVLRTVKWYSSNSAEITGDDLGEATTSVLDGGKVTTLPDDPESCDASISFQGWTNATYAKSDDAPTVFFTDPEDAPAVSGGNASYYAVWANGGTKSDVLTRETTGVTSGSTTYSDWSNKTLTSTAVYAGQSAGEHDAIQLRSKNSNSGVITTASGGKASKVSVEWESNTVAERTLNVYGKNSAYSAPTDLFATATQGTLLGTIVKGTSTELTITGDYAYIGVCSADGAIYLTSLTVQWSKISDYATTCSVPVEIADPTFSPAAGTYDNDQSVTLGFASPATAVYYTTDGTSDPKTAGTLYSSPIVVTADMTIKAIATDGNGNWSNVVTKTYTINYSPSIAAYIAKEQATTRFLRLNAAQNCIITGIREYVSGNNDKWDIYMQDASNKGIIIYGLSALPSGAAVGKRIEGAISGTYSLGNGQPRITSADLSDATFATASALTPASISAVNADAYTANPVMLVKLSGVYYKEGSYTFSANSDGSGTQNTIYDTFKYLNGKTMPANTVACDITGVLINYNGTTPELLALELTTAATATLPTISPAGGADAEHAQEVTYLSNVSVSLVDNEDVYVSVNDAEATKLTEAASITIENDTKIAVTAKRDFYADNTVTHFYKPSAYPKSISVTSAHGDVVVKVGETTVSTALPDATVTFTVTPENEHFHITSVSVTYEGGSLTPSLSENVYSFTMPDKDATIVVTYNEDAKYSVTFNGGGATGAGPTPIADQYAGVEITLPTKEEANYTAPANKQFNGWVVTETVSGDAVAVSNNQFDMPAANVTITAQWVSKIYCALTLNVNGATTTTNIDREVKYILPTEEDPISGYDFYGWAEAPELDDVEDAIDTIKAFTPAADEASKTLYAVFKRESVGADKEDELTAADLAATSTQYADFSNVQKVSNAKYAGNSAKNNAGAIQLRSSNSNSGIVSTVSGGTIKSVKITVASGSATIDVYGSNTAYAAASDLYGSSKGTKIEGTSSTKTITPAANYKYVGIRSNSGAVYLSSVTITWTPKATYYTTAPAAVNDVEYALGGGAWKENEGCEAAKVKAGQTYNICTDVPVRDHFTFDKWQIGGEDASGEITISGNTTITAVWIAKAQSNVTYNAGTGMGDDVVVENVEEGTEVTLKAIGSGEGQANFTKSGYDFVGWLSNGKLYKAGETFEMPAEAVAFVAQWKKQNITKMTLVTDVAQLVDGSKVVIAINNEQYNYLAGQLSTTNSKYLIAENSNVTFNGSEVTYSNANVTEWTLVKAENGWQLMNGENYLGANSENLSVGTTNATIWAIAVSTDGDATITSGDYTIRFNPNLQSGIPSTPRFKTYGSNSSMALPQLYASVTAISENATLSDLGFVEGDVIVVNSGAKLTMDEPSAPASITVKGNAVVNVTKAVEAGTVIVEKGAKLDIEEGGSVTTNEPLILYTTLGKGTGTTASGNAPGSSSEIIHADRLNATGDVFIEIELTQDTKASAGWYAFSVPFPVDVMNGVYYKDTKLENEVGYAIMSHDGALRAKNEYAWKKFRGIMQPGVFYVITVGNTDYKTLRFKKVAGEALAVTSTSVAVSPFPSQTGNDKDGAWNGIGNPNLQISNLSTAVPTIQFYDHKTNSFIGRDHSVNLVVGSAFFIQYGAESTVSIPTEINDGHGYLAPQRERNAVEETIYEVSLTNVTTGELEDNVFLTAREDATNEYVIGRDVAKLSLGAAKCAQMYIPAYGTQLCAADFRLVKNKATYPLTLTAPQAGTYSISVEDNDAATIYLTKDGRMIWNLSMSPCEIDLPQGTTEGYGLKLVVNAPSVVTGVDEVTGYGLQVTGAQKVIIDEHVYILRDGQMYDVDGKMVK